MISKIVPLSGFGLTATKLECYLIRDDLSSVATFYYALFTDDGYKCKEGNCAISGVDYTNWTALPPEDVNSAAISFCASEAGVELLPQELAEEVTENPLEEQVVGGLGDNDYDVDSEGIDGEIDEQDNESSDVPTVVTEGSEVPKFAQE